MNNNTLVIRLIVTTYFFMNVQIKASESSLLLNHINRIQIALTGGFTQAFGTDDNLILYPPSETNFNKWNQAIAAMQQTFAKNNKEMSVFSDAIVDINKILKQVFNELRIYYKNKGSSQNNAKDVKEKIQITEILSALRPLNSASLEIAKVRKNFTTYKKPNRLAKIKSIFTKQSTSTIGEQWNNVIEMALTSLEVLINERLLNTDLKNIQSARANL